MWSFCFPKRWKYILQHTFTFRIKSWLRFEENIYPKRYNLCLSGAFDNGWIETEQELIWKKKKTIFFSLAFHHSICCSNLHALKLVGLGLNNQWENFQLQANYRWNVRIASFQKIWSTDLRPRRNKHIISFSKMAFLSQHCWIPQTDLCIFFVFGSSLGFNLWFMGENSWKTFLTSV